MGARRQSVVRPAFGWGRLCRALLVLLVLVDFTALQTESAVELHPHHHGGPNDHCCPGCHGEHFPVLQTADRIQIAAPSISEWRRTRSVAQSASATSPTFNSSRAPPV